MKKDDTHGENDAVLQPSQEKLNPWFSMWVRPRKTMRQILDENKNAPDSKIFVVVLLFAVVLTINTMLQNSATLTERIQTSVILAAVALGLIFFAAGFLYVLAFVFKWSGRILGGQASTREVLLALTWSNIIAVWMVALIIPSYLIFGQELFPKSQFGFEMLNSISDPDALFQILSTQQSTTQAEPSIMLQIIQSVITIMVIWAIVAFLKCLAEAQRFGTWRAFFSVILGILFIEIVMLPFVLVFMFLRF